MSKDFLIADHQRTLAKIRRIYNGLSAEQKQWCQQSYRAARESILELCLNRRASNRIMEGFRREEFYR